MHYPDDKETLAKRRPLLGMGLELPTYRMGLPRLRLRARFWPFRYWALLLLALIGLVILGANLLRSTDLWQSYADAHPCIGDSDRVLQFPGWVRTLHWFNVLLIVIMVRSGLQILADHPRLYWTMHCTPQTEWVRFRARVPEGKIWTALDDSTHLSPWLGLPGGRHTSGMARHWHFLVAPTWLLLGAAFVVLLLATGQWRQLVPMSAEFIPRAAACAVSYASLHLPQGEAHATHYNALQLLAYCGIIFVLPPLQVLTGLSMSPGIGHYSRWSGRLFGNRQIARSLHFMGWGCFLAFIVVHVTLIALTGFHEKMNNMVFGGPGHGWWGAGLGLGVVLVIALLQWLAHHLSWRHGRRVQHAFQAVASRVRKAFFDRIPPRVHWPESSISPYFWPNGRPPSSAEFQAIVDGGFRDYRLRIFGEVEEPREFTLAELKAMAKHEQITEHDCVQGWSGIAKWGGVPVSTLLDLVRPKEGVPYAIFFAFPDTANGTQFYDVHDLSLLRNADSILAYEMNGAPLPLLHGAPPATAQRERARLQAGQVDSVDRARARLPGSFRGRGRLPRGSRVHRTKRGDLALFNRPRAQALAPRS